MSEWLVVIVHFHDVPGVKRLVHAAGQAGVRSHRVMVVDNSGEYPAADDACVVRCPENPGYGGAVNRAVATAARAQVEWDWLLVLTQDAQVDIGEMMTAAQNTPPLVGICGPLLRSAAGEFSCGGYVDRLGRVAHYHDGPRAGRRPVTWLDGAVLAINAATWRDVGGFCDTYFLYKEDAEFGLRGSRAGHRVLCLTTVEARQEPSAACLYLEVRNRVLFARRNLGRLRTGASVGYVAARATTRLAQVQPAQRRPLLRDVAAGVAHGLTGRLSPRIKEAGAVRRAFLFGPDGR
jgi:GT2 family glycosyltransferase